MAALLSIASCRTLVHGAVCLMSGGARTVVPGAWVPSGRGAPRHAPLPESGRRADGYAAAKRSLDVAVAATALAAMAPAFAIIALGIGLTSRGAPLFAQRRLGRGGKPFRCLKFRTMHRDAERQLVECEALRRRFMENYKLKNDPRVTPFGAVLRRTSLDELPQLLNVLLGHMSLIGPRPIVPDELVKYGDLGERLLSVKPGLGGLWQVSGRNDTSYAERIRLDMLYIERRSLRFDLWLLYRTAIVVLLRRGAC